MTDCTKCGGSKLLGPTYLPEDKLHYICRRCGYEWKTPCNDAPQTPGNAGMEELQRLVAEAKARDDAPEPR